MLSLIPFVLFVPLFIFLVVTLFRRFRVGSINNKCVLITGCDSGFGKDLCLRLDSLGCPVIATVLLDVSLTTLKSQLSSRAVVLKLDITQQSQIDAVYDQVSNKDILLWGLVNNAGIATCIGPSDLFTRDDFQRHLEVNTLGMIDMSNKFLPLIKKSRGRIVNMVSVLGRYSGMMCAPYVVSKFAARAYTETLRRELRDYGVSVHIIEPGFHRTTLTAVHNPDETVNRCFDRAASRRKYSSDFQQRLIEFNKLSIERFSTDSTKDVVDAYEHALFSLLPKSRYLVGIDAWLMFLPISLLPDWIADNLVRMIMHPPVPGPDDDIPVE